MKVLSLKLCLSKFKVLYYFTRFEHAVENLNKPSAPRNQTIVKDRVYSNFMR